MKQLWKVFYKVCSFHPDPLTSGLSLCRSPFILLWGNLIQTQPSIGASHQSSAHLAKQFQRRRLLEIGQSETRIVCGDHVPKLGMKQLWKVFYKDCSFHPDPLANMVSTDNSCLVEAFQRRRLKLMWIVNGRQTTNERRRTTRAKWW
jgi:hypothetical protein